MHRLPTRIPSTLKPLKEWASTVDVDSMRECLRAFNGKTIIEAFPRQSESSGGILLTEDSQFDRQSDAGVVIDSGAGIAAGSIVVVRRNGGKAMLGWKFPGYVPKGEIVAYGVEGGSLVNDSLRGNAMFSPRTVDVDYSIMAILDGDNWLPTGSNVLIELVAKKEKEGSILLAEVSRKQSPFGVVVAVGPKVRGVQAGMTVLLHEGAISGDRFIIDESLIYGEVV